MLLIADVDDIDHIESATITLTNRPDGGDESLSVKWFSADGDHGISLQSGNGRTGADRLSDAC